MPILRSHATLFHKRRISSMMFMSAHLCGNVYMQVGVGHAGQFVRFGAPGGAKFTKMGESLLRMPMNRRTKFDATSFILGREIRNRTNTHKQTVTNISTPCLSACVDKKQKCLLYAIFLFGIYIF